jgi:copper transport protein
MRRAFVVAAFAALGVVLAAPGASAHALLRSSTPAGGALLTTPPPEVSITFTEPPDLGLSIIHVLDSTGTDVTRARAQAVAGRALMLRLPLPTLAKGVYTVTWRVVSRVDGHLTAGSFSFGVGVAPTAPSTQQNPAGVSYRPSTLGVAGRFGLAGGLALLLGAAAVGLLVLGRPPAGRLALAVSWLLAAAGLIALIASERSQIGVPLSRLLSSDRGELLVREAVAVAILGVVVLAFAFRPGRPALIVLGGATAAALLTHALAGHAGGAQSARALKVGIQWVHLLAVGVWAGGLLWVLLASRGETSPDRLAALRRYSRLAGIALLFVVVTGSLRALDEIGAFGRLWSTDFGVTFVVKMGVFIGLVGLGALNRYRILPALGRGMRRLKAFRQSIGAEVALAAIIFGVTGVLAGLPPSALQAQAKKAVAPSRVVVEGSDFATTVRIRLVVTPGTPGPNRFEASVVDYDTRRPIEATRVSLRFTVLGRSDIPPSELVLKREGGPVWRADGTSLAVDGRWRIIVQIQTATTGIEVPLELQTRLPPQQIRVLSPGGPDQPTIYEIALGDQRTVQAYVDPASAGVVNQIHFTFFDASGGELAVPSARMEGTGPDGSSKALTVRKLGPGHYVADLEPVAGAWRFKVEARTASGEILRAYFDQRIS